MMDQTIINNQTCQEDQTKCINNSPVTKENAPQDGKIKAFDICKGVVWLVAELALIAIFAMGIVSSFSGLVNIFTSVGFVLGVLDVFWKNLYRYLADAVIGGLYIFVFVKMIISFVGSVKCFVSFMKNREDTKKATSKLSALGVSFGKVFFSVIAIIVVSYVIYPVSIEINAIWAIVIGMITMLVTRFISLTSDKGSGKIQVKPVVSDMFEMVCVMAVVISLFYMLFSHGEFIQSAFKGLGTLFSGATRGLGMNTWIYLSNDMFIRPVFNTVLAFVLLFKLVGDLIDVRFEFSVFIEDTMKKVLIAVLVFAGIDCISQMLFFVGGYGIKTITFNEVVQWFAKIDSTYWALALISGAGLLVAKSGFCKTKTK